MQKISVVLVDDLDGTEGAAETITYSLDGTQYEIDLKADNAKALREAFAPYVAVSRVTQRRRGRKPAGLAAAATDTGTKSTTAKKSTRSRSRTSTVEDIEASKAAAAKA